MGPLQVKNAVDQGSVLGHHSRLPDPPALTVPHVPSPRGFQPLAACAVGVADPARRSVRLSPADGPVVVSQHDGVRPGVEDHKLA